MVLSGGEQEMGGWSETWVIVYRCRRCGDVVAMRVDPDTTNKVCAYPPGCRCGAVKVIEVGSYCLHCIIDWLDGIRRECSLGDGDTPEKCYKGRALAGARLSDLIIMRSGATAYIIYPEEQVKREIVIIKHIKN